MTAHFSRTAAILALLPFVGGAAMGEPLSYFEEKTKAFLGSANTAPPAKSPPVAKGKKIYAIPYGVAAPSAEYWLAGIKDAAAALGWELTVIDGQFNSITQTEGFHQAIAAKADGIMTYVYDCASVQAGAKAAKAANIPIIYVSGFDCNEAGEKGPQTAYPIGLFNVSNTPEGVGGYEAFYKEMGELQGYWAVAKTKGDMKVIVIDEIDAKVTRLITEGFLDVVKKCETCEVLTTIEIVAADFGIPLQNKVSQALVKYPQANVIMGNYDDIVVSGVSAALRIAGREGKMLVTGTPGYAANIDLMHKGTQSMIAAFSVPWEGWAGMDRLNRIFNGDMELPRIGMGFTIADKDNNLTPAGQPWTPDVDFAQKYKEAWGVK